ncbi:phospholipase A2 inhibitor and Ly6/PLAUR domain-containing protein-like isoform X2 [Archocentrus centrarchus]|uniref:phospholipase A2 inhibitor and Ly6/PLAUR domain-containing protein-like isoform X2 n=1 Tax=Archocentrus centrarchus TaxID=63155 RepID=UPI0011E9B657|nr:phospholipase A2 inhibitor and Ly6/PLAUR domain-containing protein-like isoform X2 [Archocentrus centrarchus]
MQILVLILGTVLLSKACALTCYQCIPSISGSCTQTTQCPSNTQCGSLRLTAFVGGSQVSDFQLKNCSTAELCINGSVNFGTAEYVATSSCCSSDLCNSQDAPVASLSSPNGKTCFTCDGQVCNNTLNCKGNQDYCISANFTAAAGVTLKGCASKEICASIQATQIPGLGGAEISCCKGNLCNSASSSTTGILLLVAPLISLIWIS